MSDNLSGVNVFLTMIYAINIYEKGRGGEGSPSVKELHDNFAKTCTLMNRKNVGIAYF